MSVLTVDLGTSATKAALWAGADLVAIARAPVTTAHPRPGWAEQDPNEWWSSFLAACAELRVAAPAHFAAVEAMGFAAARETFVLVDDALTPLGPGILWSDRRAETQTTEAKLAWVEEHDPDAFAKARWVLAPRDLVVARLTGVTATDSSLASRTGLCDLDGAWLPEARARYGERLPEIRASSDSVGTTAQVELGLPGEVPVVLGAGDRACEVLGVDATPSTPMVSWGTTANVSVPHPGPIELPPPGAQVSQGALGGYVVEAGLAAAGAAIAWLAALTNREHDELLALAAGVPPGADGVLALPWLAGARAPWWRPDAHAALLGLTDSHGPAELTRAVVEGVAFDVARCLELIAPEADELALAGGGAASAVWREILAAVTSRPVVRRAHDDAASVGARLIVAHARGEALDGDIVNPVVAREEPDAGWVRAYEPIRRAADDACRANLDPVRTGQTTER